MTGQFGVGQSVSRREDPRLLRGEGDFIDDLPTPDGTLHAVVVRSPLAHQRITRLDVEAARAAPGVHAVYTGADLEADGVAAIACHSGPPETPWAGISEGDEFRERPQPALVTDRVRFAGEGVAFVVADTRVQALDASELVEIEFEPLAAVTACDEAPTADATLWDDIPDNVSFRWEVGDRAATDTAFDAAQHIVRLRVVNDRIHLCAMETRGALVEYGDDERWTVHGTTQMPHGFRRQLAQVFGLEEKRFRVRVDDVGGGFGGKNSLSPETILCVYAARALGRAVKWISDRNEAFLADAQGRDIVSHAELALDAEHRMTGLRLRNFANLGAYTATRGSTPPTLGPITASSAYYIPAIHAEVLACFTNTTPTDPYRGAGRPEVLYVLERLFDAAARELGIEPIELRRRNLIPPDAFPYTTPTGLTYDPCEFEAVLDAALARADVAGFAARRAESGQRGRLRGIGFSNYVERCGGGGGLSERAELLVDEDGTVTMLNGSMANGQGHDTAFSQILHSRLGLPFEKINIVQGDTDRILSGTGTGGSWSLPMGGGALVHAVDRLIERARPIAGDALEAAAADIEFRDGAFRVAGTDLSIQFEDVAARAVAKGEVRADGAPGLDADATYKPDNYTFPYGTHVCEVEIDPETGAVQVASYTAVHDFGLAINPQMLAGQVHGGLVQGLGQALGEHNVYDETGQLLSGSFMDYALPRADEVPDFVFEHWVTPSPGNPLNIKGCGEAGAAGSPPAIINAVVDALVSAGVRNADEFEMPATPERVWRMLHPLKSKG